MPWGPLEAWRALSPYGNGPDCHAFYSYSALSNVAISSLVASLSTALSVALEVSLPVLAPHPTDDVPWESVGKRGVWSTFPEAESLGSTPGPPPHFQLYDLGQLIRPVQVWFLPT